MALFPWRHPVPERSRRGSLASVSGLLALACCLAARGQLVAPPTPPPPSSAQEEAAPRPTGAFRIAGRVVDAADSRPLRHASVTLFDTTDAGRKVTETEADDGGVFSIPRLPAGKYRIQGAARGYIAAAYDEHAPYSTAIVTGAGLDTEAVVLRLQAAAMISGRVTDETGDPVRNATISLFHETYESGTRRITQFRNARTDDLGAYEIPRLPPGSYFATVRAVPWYATYPPNDPANNLGIAAEVDPALSVVYPLTFYPEATDSSGAAALELKPGARFHADFHLTPRPATHLTVQLPNPAGDGANGPNGLNGRMVSFGQNIPQLQQKVFDTFEPVMQQRAQMNGSSLEIQGLAAGSYVLRRIGQNGAVNSSETVNLSAGPVTVDSTNAPSFGSVTLLLGDISSGKLPQTLRIALRQGDAGGSIQFGGDGPTVPVKDGQAVFPNVPPGDYRIEPANARWHVDTVTENGKTVSGARLHVTGEGQTATIRLGVGSAVVTGYARRAGKAGPIPGAGAMIVLVPAAGDHSTDLYRRDQSDLDGSFRLPNVLPGNYLLLAIDDGWALEWGKPEALAPYLLKAVPVTIPPESHGTLPVQEPVPVQPR